MRSFATVLAAAVLTSSAFAQLTLIPVTTVNLDSTANSANPEFIGTNPSAVAWDGTDLVVAGFNGGAAPSIGLVRITDVFGTPTFGTSFGVIAGAPSSRGYSGIAAQGGKVVAAYDSGASIANGITLWNSDGSLAWQVTARGMAGVDFDPGFNSADFGVNYLEQGSGRRRLLDTATGTPIYTSANGAIINVTPLSTGWRDNVFNPVNGDMYTRLNNDVTKHVRTGGNAMSPNTRIVDVTDAAAVAGQNIEFLNTSLGDFLIYNDRGTTAGGQLFTNVVKVIDPNGVAQTVDWTAGFTPPTSTGYYDFSWDAANGRLAVLDFAARNVYVFRLWSGVQTYCTPGTSLNGCMPSISGVGTPSVGATSGFTVALSNVDGQRAGLMYYSIAGATAIPFGNGQLCLQSPRQRIGQPLFGGTAGACDALLSIDFLQYVATHPTALGVPFAAGTTVYFQGTTRDNGNTNNRVQSNAFQVELLP